MLRKTLADGGAELPEREVVEREFQHHVYEAERQQDREAERVIVEIKRGRSGAGGAHERQTRLWNCGPADHVGFDEPVEVAVGINEGKQAGQPRIEFQVANTEKPPQRRTDIAEIVLSGLGESWDMRRCRRRRG